MKSERLNFEVADVSGAGHMLVGDQNDVFADALLGLPSAEL